MCSLRLSAVMMMNSLQQEEVEAPREEAVEPSAHAQEEVTLEPAGGPSAQEEVTLGAPVEAEAA